MKFKIRLSTTFFFIVFLFIIFQGTVHASGYKVTGTIIDNKNDPIAHATIKVTDATTLKVVASSNSDQNGYYTLIVPKGTYNITVDPPPGSNLQQAVNSHIVIASDISLHNNLNTVGNIVNSSQHSKQVSANNWIGWVLLGMLILVILTAAGFALSK